MSVQLLNKQGKLVKIFNCVKDAYAFAMAKHIEEFSVFTQMKKIA